MNARNVRTGFHRIGLALLALMGVPSVGAMLMSLPVGMGWFPEAAQFNPADWPGFLIGGATFFVLGLLAYLAAWTLGWIVAGFAGERDKNSSR